MRRSLKERLPAYLLPHVVILLDELPLNANGKLDRDRLPDPYEVDPQPGGDVPGSELHVAVRDAWREVLGRDGIPEDINFFDAGGSSLDVLLLHDAISHKVGHKLEPTFVFEHTTIARQASALEPSEAVSSPDSGRAMNRRRSTSSPRGRR